MHVDVKLYRLLEQYDLNVHPDEQNYYDKIVLEKCKPHYINERIAIWGGGEHTEHLLAVITNHADIRNSLVCIIDKDVSLKGKEMIDYKIIHPSELNSYQIDCFIVSSFGSMNEIIEDIKAIYPEARIINIYDNHFVQQGIVKGPFFRLRSHSDLLMLRKSIENETKPHRREKLLWELIKKYLKIRDFVNSRILMEQYISYGFEKSSLLINFLEDLNKLFDDLQEALSYKDIDPTALLIIDSMRARDLKEMPYLDKFASLNVSFEQAFSASTYTIASCWSMFTGKMLLNDNLPETGALNLDQSDFFKELINEEYKIYQYSGMQIEDNNHIEMMGRSGKKVDTDFYATVSLQLWNWITDMALTSHKRIFFMLQLWELHQPYICGLHKERILLPDYLPKFYNKYLGDESNKVFEAMQQYKESRDYVDRQLEFYFKFLPKRMKLVICSDHGQCLDDGSFFGAMLPWRDENIHVPLIVHHPECVSEKVKTLYGLKNLGDLMLHLIKHDQLNYSNQPYVEIQRGPVASKRLKDNPAFGYPLNQNLFCGYKVIRGNKDKYILYDNGVEEYYLLEDEDTPQVADEEKLKLYRARINESSTI